MPETSATGQVRVSPWSPPKSQAVEIAVIGVFLTQMALLAVPGGSRALFGLPVVVMVFFVIALHRGSWWGTVTKARGARVRPVVVLVPLAALIAFLAYGGVMGVAGTTSALALWTAALTLGFLAIGTELGRHYRFPSLEEGSSRPALKLLIVAATSAAVWFVARQLEGSGVATIALAVAVCTALAWVHTVSGGRLGRRQQVPS